MKTISDFKALAAQRTWDKDVAVWVGPESSLTAALAGGSSGVAIPLDLLDLFDEAALPDSEDDVVYFLRKALREQLVSLAPPTGERRILIVKSPGILARYNLGLKEFFDWFCGDRGLVVLLIEATPEKVELPSEIECHPRAIVDYFDRPDLAKHCFTAA